MIMACEVNNCVSSIRPPKLFVRSSFVRSFLSSFVRSFLPSFLTLFVRFYFNHFVHSFVCLLARQHHDIYRLPDMSMFCFNFLDKLFHFRNRGYKIDIEKDSRTEIGLQ